MSYTKQTWQAGDEITSAKLNHLEDGINNVATEVANFPVEVNNPQDGDTLIYNAAEQKWVSGSNNGDSGGGNLVVHDNNGTLDKTWKEIHDALGAGYYTIVLYYTESSEQFEQIQIIDAYKEDNYYVKVGIAMLAKIYMTDSKNGYPAIQQSEIIN